MLKELLSIIIKKIRIKIQSKTTKLGFNKKNICFMTNIFFIVILNNHCLKFFLRTSSCLHIGQLLDGSTSTKHGKQSL